MLIDSWLSGDRDMFYNAIGHLWLPVVALALLSMAGITRLLRAAMLEECNKEYVTLARSRGRAPAHSAAPCVSQRAGHAVHRTVSLLCQPAGRAVLTETVFAWPGVGRYLTSALFAADTPAILGATLLIGTCFVLLNALADALTYLVDPRTR